MYENAGKEAALSAILRLYNHGFSTEIEKPFTEKELRKRYIKTFFTKRYASKLSRKNRREYLAALFSFKYYKKYIDEHPLQMTRDQEWAPLNP